ncbi:MAG: GntR family transcriptional regulator [Oscillospiraceae bacterium]
MFENKTSQSPLNLVSTVDALIIALTKAILDGSYSPGEQLREADLVNQYKVSRHSIREAFTTLVEQGILNKEPNRGVFIPVLTSEDIADLYKTRALFEIEAVKYAALNDMGSENLSNAIMIFEGLNENSHWSDIIEADVNFHRELVNLFNSPRISAMYKNILAEFRLCSFQARSPFYSLENTKLIHKKIAEAIESGNFDEAVMLIKSHLETSSKEHQSKLSDKTAKPAGE